MTISDKTRKLLWARSGSLCAICKCSLIEPETPHDDASVTGEEAHIHGQKPESARFDPGMSIDQIDSYNNLILLCRSHHKTIDDQRRTYTAQWLRGIKAQHESWVHNRLNSSDEDALSLYRRALAERLPSPFPGSGKNLSAATLDTLFIEPMLAEPAPRRPSAIYAGDTDHRHEHVDNENPRPWQVLMPDANHPHVLMLGDQGTGKSTAIWMLARRLCKQMRDVPIWISLPGFAVQSDVDFVSYAERESPELSNLLLHKLDAERRLVWLLDGLDEVLDVPLREKVLRAIEALQSVQPPRQILVTSRPQPEPQLSSQFIRCEIAPWNDETMEIFVSKYFEITRAEPDSKHRSQRFLTGLRANTALYELCQTPLFLSIVLSLGANSELPWPRPRLYRDALLNVLGEWDAQKSIISNPEKNLHPEDKLVFLRKIALRMLDRRQLSISLDELSEMSFSFCMESFPDDVQEATSASFSLIWDLRCRSAILFPDASGNLAFSLRAWFDCSAALELSNRRDELAELYDNHWDDPLWAEPLMLAVGFLAQENTPVVLPLLRQVLRSCASLEGFIVAESFYFVVRALSYCVSREPLVSFAKRLTQAILSLDGDASAGLAGALREAGPRWPGANALRGAGVNLGLAVSDTKTRLGVILFYLPYEDWASEVKDIIQQARRLGPWDPAEVRAVLELKPPSRPNKGPHWPSFLRIHVATAIFLLDQHPLAREFLESQLHSAESEVQAYAALVLVSVNENAQARIWVLHSALERGIWRGYVPAPLRHFLYDRIEACRSLVGDERDFLIEILQNAPSELIRDLGQRLLVAPERPSSIHRRWRPDGFVREILALDDAQPITVELLAERLPTLQDGQAIHILGEVARNRILPRKAWRALAEAVLPHCAASFDRYEVACLLGARDVLVELTDENVHEQPTPDAARSALNLGEAIDAVLR